VLEPLNLVWLRKINRWPGTESAVRGAFRRCASRRFRHSVAAQWSALFRWNSLLSRPLRGVHRIGLDWISGTEIQEPVSALNMDLTADSVKRILVW